VHALAVLVGLAGLFLLDRLLPGPLATASQALAAVAGRRPMFRYGLRAAHAAAAGEAIFSSAAARHVTNHLTAARAAAPAPVFPALTTRDHGTPPERFGPSEWGSS